MNINDEILFTLTVHGAAVLRESGNYIATPPTRGDVLTMPLWEFCEAFGPRMSHGSPPVAVNNELHLVREEPVIDPDPGPCALCGHTRASHVEGRSPEWRGSCLGLHAGGKDRACGCSGYAHRSTPSTPPVCRVEQEDDGEFEVLGTSSKTRWADPALAHPVIVLEELPSLGVDREAICGMRGQVLLPGSTVPEGIICALPYKHWAADGGINTARPCCGVTSKGDTVLFDPRNGVGRIFRFGERA